MVLRPRKRQARRASCLSAILKKRNNSPRHQVPGNGRPGESARQKTISTLRRNAPTCRHRKSPLRRTKRPLTRRTLRSSGRAHQSYTPTGTGPHLWSNRQTSYSPHDHQQRPGSNAALGPNRTHDHGTASNARSRNPRLAQKTKNHRHAPPRRRRHPHARTNRDIPNSKQEPSQCDH